MTQSFTPKFELENNTYKFYDFSEFREFLVDNKVIVTIVSFTIATYLNELIKSFFDDFIFCFLSPDCDQDKVPDFAFLFKYELNILGIKIKLGKLFLALIKFTIAAFLVFFISRFFNDIIN